eukprot:5442180-Heterocapsa_arctica.AAC.1
MTRAFALSYGEGYSAPILKFLRHLQTCHETNDHKYPFAFIADAWEELFWRQTEEIRYAVAATLKIIGKDDA